MSPDDSMKCTLLNRIAIAVVVFLTGACSANETTTKQSLPPVTPIMVPPTMTSATEPALGGRGLVWQSTEPAGGERIFPTRPNAIRLNFSPTVACSYVPTAIEVVRDMRPARIDR